MSDYASYLPSLRTTTLFCDMSDEEMLLVLNAMHPPVKEGSLTPPAHGGPHRAFRMVVRSGLAEKASPRRFKYESQKFGEPGMLMGEVVVLSRKEDFIKPTPLSIKPALPKVDYALEALEFTPEMLVAYYGPEVSCAQGKVLRNLLGMLAQKIVDVRRELYLERSGYDIYSEENRIVEADMLDTLS